MCVCVGCISLQWTCVSDISVLHLITGADGSIRTTGVHDAELHPRRVGVDHDGTARCAASSYSSSPYVQIILNLD